MMYIYFIIAIFVPWVFALLLDIKMNIKAPQIYWIIGFIAGTISAHIIMKI